MVGNEAWTIIGIPAVNNLDTFLSTQRNFLNNYQEVETDRNPLTRPFEMGVPELRGYRFFQDITPFQMANTIIDIQGHNTKPMNALAPYIAVHYFEDSWDFEITLPYEDTPTIIPMNEALATYATMFYLSSLVRYRPDYLESLLNHKPAWLIESFVNSTPETFLRIMICKIIGTDFTFRRR